MAPNKLFAWRSARGRGRARGGGGDRGNPSHGGHGGGQNVGSSPALQSPVPGSKRQRSEQDDIGPRKQRTSEQRFLNWRNEPETADTAAFAYARVLNNSPSAYTTYTPGQYEVTRNERGEIIDLKVKAGEQPLQQCLPSDLSITIKLKRVSRDLGEGLISRDEEYEQKYKSFVSTQDKFAPTWYTWDQVDAVRDPDGNIVNLTPRKGEERNPGNFAIIPSGTDTGVIGKFDNGHARGLRVKYAMFLELFKRSGAEQAFALMETAHWDPETGDSCIMTLFPDKGVESQLEDNMELQVYQGGVSGHDDIPNNSEDEEIAYYRAGDVDISRAPSHQIVDLTPKDQSKDRVNFISVNPDNPGYIAKYDSSAKGMRVQKAVRELIGRVFGREQGFGLGPAVPVPGQKVDNAAEFQFVQTATFAQLKAIKAGQEASH